MKKNLTKVAAFALLAIATSFEASAQLASQQNLGSACGCPPVASRPTVSMSTLAVVGGATDGDLLSPNTVLTCDKTYLLDNKIYVQDGKSLTIQPGTVIKGVSTGTTAAANAILVNRGGKIFANGSASCPIVFTAFDDNLDGTYALTNKGKWGGIILLGKAKNNLTTAANYSAAGTVGFAGTALNSASVTLGTGQVIPSGYNGGDGVGFIEGFLAADSRNLYGMPVGYEDDNDNSGIMRYVSIRHAGATVGANNEINGLTLGSVGRGTTLEYIEVVSNDDDGIEFFGGTVNLKYATVMFNNDDAFDYDQGWKGKGQFWFGVKLDATTFTGGDNGFEMDLDDQKANPGTTGGRPVIYNATMIGNGSTTTPTGGGGGPFALQFKERAEGEIYSSIFANYKSGVNIIKSLGTRTGAVEAYHNWTGVDNASAATPVTLKFECNTFVGNTSTITVGGSAANVLAADNTKFAADNNVSVATLAGLDFTFAATGTTVSDQYNAQPNPAVATTCVAPADGFFTPATYRGAFALGQTSWLTDWAYSALIDATNNLISCPTDLTKDGITNTSDFLELVGQFGQSCD